MGQEGEEDKTTKYRQPERKRDGYRNDKNSQFRSHHGKRAAQSKNSSGSTHRDSKRRRQKHEQYVAQDTARKINHQKSAGSNQPKQVASKEIKGEHVSKEMPETTVDKEVGQYGPWAKQETRRLQAEEKDECRNDKSGYIQQEVQPNQNQYGA